MSKNKPTTRQKIAILLAFPEGTIDKLQNRISVSEIDKTMKDRDRMLHYFYMLEYNGLAKSEMIVVKSPTETQKGRTERVFWATEECLKLNQALTTFLKGVIQDEEKK